MLTFVPNTAQTIATAPPAGKVLRTPFYLESQGEALFAWLHQPEKTTQKDQAVILCPPLGCEQIRAHRSLRHLADALAQAGLPVLRIDYHGTGDSAGIDENSGRYAAWLASIRDARSWMEERLGYKQISLIGVRLGASLALQLAAEAPIKNLVLWAPVLTGRSYMREIKALSLIAEPKPQPLPEAPDDIEAAGFVLSKQTADDLGRLDLLKSHPRCQRVLIVARDDRPEDTRLLKHLSGLGINAEQIIQPGFAGMTAEPHYTKVPRQAIAGIVAWLQARITMENMPTAAATVACPGPLEALISPQQYTQVPTDKPRRIRERVLSIDSHAEVFGIISEPENGPLENLPTIVMPNAGSAYRVGPNRLYVILARHLAAQGFRCLRMDLGGLGDSVAANPASENDPYPATAFRDIDLTLKHLQEHLGVKRVVLMGLCSGAYAAFQAAVQITNPVLVESVLINPLTFYWKEGMSLEAAPVNQLSRFHYYMKAALQPTKWLRVLTGRSQIGIFGALKMLVQRWRMRNLSGDRSANGCAEKDGVVLSHPQHEDMPGDLDRVVIAGRRLAFFFATSDPGYSILMFHAKRKVDMLRRTGILSFSFIEDADHSFSNRVPRRAVVQAISDYLCQRYQ